MTPGEVAFEGYYKAMARRGRVPRTYNFQKLSLASKRSWEEAAEAVVKEISNRLLGEVLVPIYEDRVNGFRHNVSKQRARDFLLVKKPK